MKNKILYSAEIWYCMCKKYVYSIEFEDSEHIEQFLFLNF